MDADNTDPVITRLYGDKPPKAIQICFTLDREDFEAFEAKVAQFNTNRSKLARNIIKSYIYGDLK